jgi:DNA invertase Pin-like site-specific DNA recombinase
MPNSNSVGIMAVAAEDERLRISARTKAALAAAKVRGTKLGGNRGVKPAVKMRIQSAVARQQRASARAAAGGRRRTQRQGYPDCAGRERVRPR